MKTLLLAIFLTMSISAHASTVTATEDSSLNILSNIVELQLVSNEKISAKIFSIVGGDGLNPTRIIITFETGNDDHKIFELETPLYSVDSFELKNNDTLILVVIQDSFDINDEVIQIKKTITVTAHRNSKGDLTDKITVEQ